MAVALGFSAVLIIITIFIHYEAFRLISWALPRNRIPPRPLIVAVMFGIAVAHTVEIVVYAVAYYYLENRFGLGGFSEKFVPTYTNYFHYSAVSFTTLGLSTFHATGPLKIISDMEGLNGFLLITWSATFGYTAVGRFWEQDADQK